MAAFRKKTPEELRLAKAERNRRYLQSDKGRAMVARSHKKYAASEAGQAKIKNTAAAYRASPEGKATLAAAHQARLKDPNYKAAKALRSRFYAAVVSQSTKSSAIGNLGCTIAEFRAYIEAKWQPGMSWDNLGKVWHLDHIKALGFFDLTEPEQMAVAAHYSNHQPLFTPDHYMKTAEDIRLMKALRA